MRSGTLKCLGNHSGHAPGCLMCHANYEVWRLFNNNVRQWQWDLYILNVTLYHWNSYRNNSATALLQFWMALDSRLAYRITRNLSYQCSNRVAKSCHDSPWSEMPTYHAFIESIKLKYLCLMRYVRNLQYGRCAYQYDVIYMPIFRTIYNIIWKLFLKVSFADVPSYDFFITKCYF